VDEADFLDEEEEDEALGALETTVAPAPNKKHRRASSSDSE